MRATPLQEMLRKNVRALRMSLGMSQHALARAAGITPAQASNIERGKSSPTLDTIVRIAITLGVGADELLSDGCPILPPASAPAAAASGGAGYSIDGMDRLMSKIAAGAPGAAVPEYELAGIETIARGVCIRGGRLLVCRAKGSKTCYLPGGHIEFGETGRQALVREMAEETGLAAETGRFMGAVENSFLQHGKRHAEINLVYEMSVPGAGAKVKALESWISFSWEPLDGLDAAGLLPEAFRALSSGARDFAC